VINNAPAALTAAELAELQARLEAAEETLRAIRAGEVDALVVNDGSGEKIYALRTADAPYRALVEQMDEGAATLDARGNIVYGNRRLADLVGIPLTQVIGAPIAPYIDAADRPAVASLIGAGAAGKIPTRLLRGDGRVLDVHLSISPVVLDGAEYRTLIVTDLTVLTRVQRENRSKDEFLAMLAHELRNPLSVLEGAAHVISLTSVNDDYSQRARAIIGRQVRHMSRLVDDLLDVGRVVTGKVALHTQALDLAEAVRAHVGTFVDTRPDAARVELHTEPAWVHGDAARIEQIVGNLLTNAVKFTPAGSRIHVSVRAEGADAMLRVADEGTGIDPESLSDIFEPFMQAPQTLDRSQGGLGLGLTLVRRLVELHGGTVEASSAGRGLGATFTVRLPLTAARARPSTNDAACERGSRRRILIVDDNRDGLAMQQLLLAEHGHEVAEAHDGYEALERLAEVEPELALIDIGLPGMDGYELARRIRATPQGGRVALVAITGYGFPEDIERSHEAGFVRHLVKPVAPDELLRIVDEVSAARPA
jgi:PAS domain S-box-containing protein